MYVLSNLHKYLKGRPKLFHTPGSYQASLTERESLFQSGVYLESGCQTAWVEGLADKNNGQGAGAKKS